MITTSRDSARRVLDYMPEVAPKLSVVHHGVAEGFAPVADEARRDAVRARHGLPERFLLYVGQVYPQKNVAGILRALALLRDRIPHPLVMAGRPSLKAERDMRLVERLGLGDRVRFTGWVADEDLPVLYSLADAFVFPSLYEGFGIPLLEAMACGCPVVTSTGGSCAEVVGEAGLCVDPTDPAAIAGGSSVCHRPEPRGRAAPARPGAGPALHLGARRPAPPSPSWPRRPGGAAPEKRQLHEHRAPSRRRFLREV